MSAREREQDVAGRACGHDAGAYVLDALDDAQDAAFRRHLDACALCRDEVRRLSEVAARLPLTAPQLAVPRSLRRRVLGSLRERGRSDAPSREPFARLRALAPALVLLAVALLAAGATYAGVELTRGGAGPNARVVRASVSSPAARAVVTLRSGRAELIVRGMPAPAAGKVYEVWLVREGRAPIATSALFDVAADGSAAVDVPGDMRGVSEVLVTPEQRGGSARPTHPPVISARLT